MVIMGTVLLAVILISLVNLIADIAMVLLDPRVRLA
jgi:ABC-type dipeptide/oligopeptide/nickel transport system permease component